LGYIFFHGGLFLSQKYADTIISHYPSFSQSEKKVADYILDNMTAVLRMSVHDLKKAAGVSEPTIFRFCRVLGFSGYKDFKITMAQHASTYEDYFMSGDQSETRVQTLVQRTLQSEIEIIETPLRLMDFEQLEQAASRVMQARRICLFGAGTSVEICHDLRRKLSRLGLSVWSYNDFHEAISLLSSFTAEDLFIGITHSGVTRETGDILRIASDRKAYTMLITAYPNTRFKRYANLILRTYAYETVDNRISLASRVGQFALADALYIAVASLLGTDILPMMERTTRDVSSHQDR
jgi:DNA-binding MurR/RpiR family transcriptional regulator